VIEQMRIRIAVALIGLGVVGWTGSTAAQTSVASAAPAGSETDVQALRERAAAFWAARVATDLQAQWNLLEPRGKGRVTPQEYGEGRGAVKYLAYQIEGATVSGLFATVKVRLLIQPVVPSPTGSRIPPQAAVVDDGWVRVGGIWYRKLDEGENARSPAR
jgi:hypothetical protein